MIEAADLTDYWSMKSAWVWIILEILQVTQPWRTTMINKISVSCCKIRLKKYILKLLFLLYFWDDVKTTGYVLFYYCCNWMLQMNESDEKSEFNYNNIILFETEPKI